MSKDPHFIKNENSLENICYKQVSQWDTSSVAALLMKTSVSFVMIAIFKSEDTGILNRSKIKASKYHYRP